MNHYRQNRGLDVWIEGGGEWSWRRKYITNGKEEGRNYRLHSFAQGRPQGKGFVCLLYFPLVLSVITITAHWFSILSINTFIGHSDIIKISSTPLLQWKISLFPKIWSLQVQVFFFPAFFFKWSSHISNHTDSAYVFLWSQLGTCKDFTTDQKISNSGLSGNIKW